MVEQVLTIKKGIKVLLIFAISLIISGIFPNIVLADPQSAHYVFKDYSFGGSTGTGNSSNYRIMGTAGEGVAGKGQSANYFVNEGLAFTANANVPPAPTFTNPSSYYNKLSMTINTGSNPTDATYAIAVSPDNFATTTKYVQSDYTLGSNPVWRLNSAWGASGFTLIGLTPGTTYTAKVTATQGNYTQSTFGPTAQATTVNPTLSLSVSPNSVSIGSLTAGSVTTAATTVTVTVSSNGNSGASVYVSDSKSGLFSPTMNYTISALSGDLGGVSEGYGLRGTSTTQTSGGPMEIISPYNGAGTTVGTLSTTNQAIFDSTSQPVTNGQGVFEIKAKSSSTTKAASDYADTLTLIASSIF